MAEANSPEAVEGVLRAWQERLADEQEFSAGFYRANMKTHLAGVLFVADVDFPERIVKLAGGNTSGPAPAFLELDFPEAIDHFASRKILSAAEFYALDDAERFRSFTVAESTSRTITASIYRNLRGAMRPGGVGLREFQAAWLEEFEGDGSTKRARRYLENVYRTSTSVSYNAGRFEAQTSERIEGLVRFWQYLGIPDSRIRESHLELHLKMWPKDDPAALEVYPPNGYQCRCTMTVTDEPDDSQLSRGVDTAAATQEGFSGPPTGDIYGTD